MKREKTKANVPIALFTIVFVTRVKRTNLIFTHSILAVWASQKFIILVHPLRKKEVDHSKFSPQSP